MFRSQNNDIGATTKLPDFAAPAEIEDHVPAPL
jgi:hypothetical protein